MNKIYAPWRSNYVDDVVHGKEENTMEEECIFCTKFAAGNDEQQFIIRRFEHTAALFNIYPYNAGHILILPFEHKKSLAELKNVTRSELMHVISASIDTLQQALNPDGYNIGMNLGKAGGAGIPAHLHMHIVPRWEGDTNFLPLIAETKVISFDLKKIYRKLKPVFDNITLSPLAK